MGTAEHLEKTVIFLVEAEPLALQDSTAAELVQKASGAALEEARAEAALSAAARATEAARQVMLYTSDLLHAEVDAGKENCRARSGHFRCAADHQSLNDLCLIFLQQLRFKSLICLGPEMFSTKVVHEVSQQGCNALEP